MDTGIIFLLGVYLVPLALVSAVSAWADGRRPYVALGLGVAGVGLALLGPRCARTAITGCATYRS